MVNVTIFVDLAAAVAKTSDFLLKAEATNIPSPITKASRDWHISHTSRARYRTVLSTDLSVVPNKIEEIFWRGKYRLAQCHVILSPCARVTKKWRFL